VYPLTISTNAAERTVGFQVLIQSVRNLLDVTRPRQPHSANLIFQNRTTITKGTSYPYKRNAIHHRSIQSPSSSKTFPQTVSKMLAPTMSMRPEPKQFPNPIAPRTPDPQEKQLQHERGGKKYQTTHPISTKPLLHRTLPIMITSSDAPLIILVAP
jgi:hypothetical protein